MSAMVRNTTGWVLHHHLENIQCEDLGNEDNQYASTNSCSSKLRPSLCCVSTALCCVLCTYVGLLRGVCRGLMAQTQVKLSVYSLYSCLQAGHDRLSYNTSPLIILMIHITPGTWHHADAKFQEHWSAAFPKKIKDLTAMRILRVLYDCINSK